MKRCLERLDNDFMSNDLSYLKSHLMVQLLFTKMEEGNSFEHSAMKKFVNSINKNDIHILLSILISLALNVLVRDDESLHKAAEELKKSLYKD